MTHLDYTVFKIVTLKRLINLVPLILFFVGMTLFVKSQAFGQTVDKPRVAVLTLRNRIEMTQSEVDYLTSLVRQATADYLAKDYVIMTQENIEVLLPPDTNLDDCVSECQVETGRVIGAHYIITGEVLRFGKTLRLTIRMHETKIGRLVASSRVKGKTIEELEEPSVSAVASMLAKISPNQSSASVRDQPQPPTQTVNTVEPERPQPKRAPQRRVRNSDAHFDLSGVSLGLGYLMSEGYGAIATVSYRFTKNHQLKLGAHAFINDDFYNEISFESESDEYSQSDLTGLYIAYVYNFWLFTDWLFVSAGVGAGHELGPAVEAGAGLRIGRSIIGVNIISADIGGPYLTLDVSYTF